MERQTAIHLRATATLAHGERLMLGGAGLVALLVLIFICVDFSFFNVRMPARGLPIAALTHTYNTVRHRAAALPNWEEARTDDKLFARDHLFTDKDSSARFKFLNGELIQVGENTLVVVEDNEAGEAVEIKQGTILAAGSIGAGPSRVLLRVGQTRTVLSGKDSRALIRVHPDGRATVAMIAGRGEIESNGQRLMMGPSDGGEISRGGELKAKTWSKETHWSKIFATADASHVGPELEIPESGKNFSFDASGSLGSPVELRWRDQFGATTYRVQVASDAMFSRLLIDTDTEQNRIDTPELPPGRYHWRVRVRNSLMEIGGSPWSAVKDFVVLRSVQTPDVAPKVAAPIVSPAVAMPMTATGTTNAHVNAAGVTAVVAPPAAVVPVAAATTAPAVRPIAKAVATPQPAPVAMATAAPIAPLQLPELLEPKSGFVANFDPDERRELEFQWTVPAGLQDVKIVVSRASDFQHPVVAKAVEGDAVKLQVEDDGLHYWYVEGQDTRAQVAVRSHPSSFLVQTSTIEKNKDVSERLRVEGGWVPGLWTYRHSVESSDTISSTSFNFLSGYAGLLGWINQHVGVDVQTHVRQLKLNVRSNADETTGYEGDEKSYSPTYMDFLAALTYRNRFLPNGFPIAAGLRGGYFTNSVTTFTPLEAGGYTLLATRAHNVLVGAGLGLPAGHIFTLDGRLDYMHLLASDPATLKDAQQYASSWSLLHNFLGSGVMGYGILYHAARYRYEDPDQYQGKVASSFLGFMYSVGFMF